MVCLRSSACLAIVVWLLSTGVAPVEAAASDENILLLGVTRAGRTDLQLTRELAEHLARCGEVVHERTALSHHDRACTDEECLDALAARDNAQIVLTAQVQQNGEDSYFLVTTLFDAVRRAPLSQRSLCDHCQSDMLLFKLADTATTLLGRYRERKQGAAGDPATKPRDQPAADGDAAIRALLIAHPAADLRGAGRRVVLSKRRKLVAGVLGGLAGISLTSAIVLTATDRQATSLPCGQMGCVLDNRGLYASGYILTGLLVGAVAATVFWPERTNEVEGK